MFFCAQNKCTEAYTHSRLIATSNVYTNYLKIATQTFLNVRGKLLSFLFILPYFFVFAKIIFGITKSLIINYNTFCTGSRKLMLQNFIMWNKRCFQQMNEWILIFQERKFLFVRSSLKIRMSLKKAVEVLTT